MDKTAQVKRIIRKSRAGYTVPPNLGDYALACRSFSWEDARRELSDTSRGALNIGRLAADRNAEGPSRNRTALRCIDASMRVRTYTYGELQRLTDRFASVLQDLGIQQGDCLFTLAGRIPELYVAALGALKLGAVFCPLFSAYGPEPIRSRMKIGEPRVLVTTERLYERKVAAIRESVPSLEHVIVVGDCSHPGTHNFEQLMNRADRPFRGPATASGSPALLHFTSGTTGAPKGAVHSHEAVVAHYATGKLALDLHPGDRFWCTADHGWVTATVYGIIAPLVIGATLVVDESEFEAERWLRVLQEERVTVWYTAPTAVRMLMTLGKDILRSYDTSALRFLASVGEPLHPDAVLWAEEVFDLPLHENWWQTETGAIMIANFLAMDLKPGSMGRPVPGVEAAIVQRQPRGPVKQITQPGVTGELALRKGWPSMFGGYLGEDERYRECFVGEWYLTGDLARRDEDGYFWFVGRADDVIKSAGHLIGPSEVEAALLEHPAVLEVGVIGKPHAVAGEIVKAFVTLRAGFAPGDDLRFELLAHARKHLGPAVAPKEIEFHPELPKTSSGKIVRRLLKEQEFGLSTANSKEPESLS